MQTKTFFRISMLAVLVVSIFVLVNIGEKIVPTINIPSPTVEAPLGRINIEIASTSASREQGLSGRTSLPPDAGMLFVFENPGVYGFWMKDMSFPIDIVWITEAKTVAGVTSRLSPETYPNVFGSPLAILYVLELNSGGADKYGIATGTKLVF